MESFQPQLHSYLPPERVQIVNSIDQLPSAGPDQRSLAQNQARSSWFCTPIDSQAAHKWLERGPSCLILGIPLSASHMIVLISSLAQSRMNKCEESVWKLARGRKILEDLLQARQWSLVHSTEKWLILTCSDMLATPLRKRPRMWIESFFCKSVWRHPKGQACELFS